MFRLSDVTDLSDFLIVRNPSGCNGFSCSQMDPNFKGDFSVIFFTLIPFFQEFFAEIVLELQLLFAWSLTCVHFIFDSSLSAVSSLHLVWAKQAVLMRRSDWPMRHNFSGTCRCLFLSLASPDQGFETGTSPSWEDSMVCLAWQMISSWQSAWPINSDQGWLSSWVGG